MDNRHGGAFGYHRSRDGPLLIHRLRPLDRDLPGTPWKCECEFVAGVVDDDNLAPRIPSVRRLDVVYHNIAPWNGSRDITVHRFPTGHAEAGMRVSQCDGAGNARVRRGMIQLAWRFLLFQMQSALALWYRARTADSRLGTRKTMIVALARKLMIALWRFVTTGETLEGVILRPARLRPRVQQFLPIRRSRWLFGGLPN